MRLSNWFTERHTRINTRIDKSKKLIMRAHCCVYWCKLMLFSLNMRPFNLTFYRTASMLSEGFFYYVERLGMIIKLDMSARAYYIIIHNSSINQTSQANLQIHLCLYTRISICAHSAIVVHTVCNYVVIIIECQMGCTRTQPLNNRLIYYMFFC